MERDGSCHGVSVAPSARESPRVPPPPTTETTTDLTSLTLDVSLSVSIVSSTDWGRGMRERFGPEGETQARKCLLRV